ncbi:MAG TPA: DUF4405 domain-containing protein [Methanosarcina sp.]|nr:DUF4405 domain-containing protein [Methanosarcina sp.]
MNKQKLNFINEALMFLVLSGLLGIGISLRLKMHLYGDIHYYLGLILVVLVLTHIYLHWTQIVKMYQKLMPDPGKRKIVSIIYVLIITILLLVFTVSSLIF